MASKYKVLSQDQQDETIVQCLLGLEASHHSHTVNVERYSALLVTLTPGTVRYDQIANLLKTESEALDFHDHLIASTQNQLPDKTRMDAASARIMKRNA